QRRQLEHPLALGTSPAVGVFFGHPSKPARHGQNVVQGNRAEDNYREACRGNVNSLSILPQKLRVPLDALFVRLNLSAERSSWGSTLRCRPLTPKFTGFTVV